MVLFVDAGRAVGETEVLNRGETVVTDFVPLDAIAAVGRPVPVIVVVPDLDVAVVVVAELLILVFEAAVPLRPSVVASSGAKHSLYWFGSVPIGHCGTQKLLNLKLRQALQAPAPEAEQPPKHSAWHTTQEVLLASQMVK